MLTPAKISPLPSPPPDYSPTFFLQFIRTLELFFSKITSNLNTLSGLASPYVVRAFSSGRPTASQIIAFDIATRLYTFAPNFAGSQFLVPVATRPTATAALAVNKVSAAGVVTAIGSVSISTAGVAAFTTSGLPKTIDVGEGVQIVAQGSPDATFSGFSVNLTGS